MDSDCLICLGSHGSKECEERKLQHCADCHMFIRYSSDHSPVCGNKQWVYDVYDKLYASTPLVRCNIGFNCVFRFFQNKIWHKPCEDIDAYSTTSGILFRFKSDKDLSLLSNEFVHGRILVVVKDTDGAINEKLVLMTSKAKMMVATLIDKPFDRVAAEHTYGADTSLILAVSGDCNPVITISLFPKSGLARHHELRYDSTTKSFQIPFELTIDAANPVAMTTKSCDTVAVYTNFQQSLKAASGQQNTDERCFECHVPVQRIEDHMQECGAKWFISRNRNVYAKIPTIRCVIRFETPPRLFMNRKFKEIESDGIYFSPMSDTFFKIEKNGTIQLLTTGFTRIRIPIIVEIMNGALKTFKEKMVLVTSQDRTIVCAKDNRNMDPANGIVMCKHNTPLMVCIGNTNTTVKLEVHSRGANLRVFEIPYRAGQNGFQIPSGLDISSKVFNLDHFDADLPEKKQKRSESKRSEAM